MSTGSELELAGPSGCVRDLSFARIQCRFVLAAVDDLGGLILAEVWAGGNRTDVEYRFELVT